MKQVNQSIEPIFFPICCKSEFIRVELARGITLLRIDQDGIGSKLGLENLRFGDSGIVTGFLGSSSPRALAFSTTINMLATLTMGHPIERIGRWFNFALKTMGREDAEAFKLLTLLLNDCASVPAFGITLGNHPLPNQYRLFHFPCSKELAVIESGFISSWRELHQYFVSNYDNLNYFVIEKFLYAESSNVLNRAHALFEHVSLQAALLMPMNSSNQRKSYSNGVASFLAHHLEEADRTEENRRMAKRAYSYRDDVAHGKNIEIDSAVYSFVKGLSRKLLIEHIQRPESFELNHLEFINRQ